MHGHFPVTALAALAVALGSGCAPPGRFSAGHPAAFAASGRYDNPLRDDELAALNALNKRNYEEAFRLFKKIDAEGDAAVASIPPGPEVELPDGHRSVYASSGLVRSGTISTLASAREQIGEFYEKGLDGVGQNYATAVSWYQKAGLDIRARYRLAFLYASGTGVQPNRAKAREILVSLGPGSARYVTLLDRNLLPKTFDDATPAYMAQAFGAIEAKDAEIAAPKIAAAKEKEREEAENDARDDAHVARVLREMSANYTFICRRDESSSPLIITVDSGRKAVRFEQNTRNGIPCNNIFVNGVNAPTFIGATAGYCTFGSNDRVHQAVSVDSTGFIILIADEKELINAITLDFRTGIYRSKQGDNIECHKAQS